MGEATHFLVINFTWTRDQDDHLTVHLTQETFADNLVDTADLTTVNPVPSPYRPGRPVDVIPLHLPSLVAPYN